VADPLAIVVTVAVAAMWPTATSSVTARPGATVAAASPAVGALFTVRAGQLRAHFCSASVVDSPGGDLLVTAAHCVQGYLDASLGRLAFVPGYDHRTAPYGVWAVTRIFVDSSWASTNDPDDDVAFLAVAQQPGTGAAIEDVTGADRLGVGQPLDDSVLVTGYPDAEDQPISCQNRTTALNPSQMRFDCAGYTAGTSGGPFLTGVDPGTGQGTVIGVIGGYQQGGYTPDISYSATFGQNVRALYGLAVTKELAAEHVGS